MGGKGWNLTIFGRGAPPPTSQPNACRSYRESGLVHWRDYDESLRRRGSVTVWFSDEAVEAWEAERRTSRGGQPEYSDLAILTALTFKTVFRLAYRQTEGLIGSVIG